jgi:cell division protein FtsW (lipid II flippase)
VKKNIWSQFKFPLLILLAFVLAAAWVGVGRLVFGVFGWMAFITLFMFAPIVVVYGLVLTIIASIRQRTYRYRRRGPFVLWLTATLIALFCVGFFMPDGGDTPESIGSALSVVLLDRTNSAYIGVSSVLAMWSIFAVIFTSIVTFVLAFAERPKKHDGAAVATPLKQTK